MIYGGYTRKIFCEKFRDIIKKFIIQKYVFIMSLVDPALTTCSTSEA